MAEESRLPELAARYLALSRELEENKDSLNPEKVLDCLLTRDRIAYLLNRNGPPELATAQLITQGDYRLKVVADQIGQMEPLQTWRDSFYPLAEAWWWPYPAAGEPVGFWKRFDWLWTALALVCLTLALGLVADISPRFLSGGPDTWGAMAVVIQSVLALLTTGSILTRTGQNAAERILNSLSFPRRLWEEAGFMAAGLLLVALLIFRLSLPQVAVAYNDRGLNNYCAGQLSSARFDYQRALKLNPDYAEAHFNLGRLYEDLQDFEQARTHYQLAVQQGGPIVAYNNLARLHILEENYATAVSLLLTGQRQIGQGEIKEELTRCQPEPGLIGQNVPVEAPAELLEYAVYKNLGWARLGQERYQEAEIYLQTAVDLLADKAPAYCLLAQVRENQGAVESALATWENCLRYASSFNVDEDVWIGLARQRLQTQPEGN